MGNKQSDVMWNGKVDTRGTMLSFLENGINVNAVAHYGETALDCTYKAEENREEIVALLASKYKLEPQGKMKFVQIANSEVTSKNEPLPQLQRCSKCKKIFYCGRTCQRLQWRSKHRAQ